jgi:hypothetical protein
MTTCQHERYREVLALLFPYGSANCCAPVLRTICNHAPPDESSKGKHFRALGVQQLLEGSSKLQWLCDFLKGRLVDPYARIVIFADLCHSRDLLYSFFSHAVGNAVTGELHPQLAGLSRLAANRVPQIDGSVDTASALSAISDFEHGRSSPHDTPLVIASRGSAGRAFNLPFVTDIINWDVVPSIRSWWQGTYRGLRPPRAYNAPLAVFDLVLRDTIEEGQFYARWAREALSSALVPSEVLAMHDPHECDEDTLARKRDLLNRCCHPPCTCTCTCNLYMCMPTCMYRLRHRSMCIDIHMDIHMGMPGAHVVGSCSLTLHAPFVAQGAITGWCSIGATCRSVYAEAITTYATAANENCC